VSEDAVSWDVGRKIPSRNVTPSFHTAQSVCVTTIMQDMVCSEAKEHVEPRELQVTSSEVKHAFAFAFAFTDDLKKHSAPGDKFL